MCVGEGKGDRDREFIRGRSVPIFSQTRFDSINILHIWMVRPVATVKSQTISTCDGHFIQ